MTTTSPPVPPASSSRGGFIGATALAWWKEHCHPEHGDPATRARLRRARSSLDVLAIPAAVILARRLGAARTPEHGDRALDLARILAHVRVHGGLSPMRAAGWPRFPFDTSADTSPEQRPRLSEARFRRLIRAERHDGELASAFVRLVALLGGEVAVPSLAEAFWYWDADEDRIRRRWAFEYYAAGIAAPAAEPTGSTAVDSDEDSRA